jgi:hypothetical protein
MFFSRRVGTSATMLRVTSVDLDRSSTGSTDDAIDYMVAELLRRPRWLRANAAVEDNLQIWGIGFCFDDRMFSDQAVLGAIADQYIWQRRAE